MSGRNSLRLTRPCVAFSIFLHRLADARRLPRISMDSQTSEMPKYWAISTFAPRGSPTKYSSNVTFFSNKLLVAGTDLQLGRIVPFQQPWPLTYTAYAFTNTAEDCWCLTLVSVPHELNHLGRAVHTILMRLGVAWILQQHKV